MPERRSARSTYDDQARPEDHAAARGRPGRRTLAERKEPVPQVPIGQASIDQVAARLGVYPKTVEMWRDQALEGMSEALLRGDVGTERERENEELRETLADVLVNCAIPQ